jgi:hypothetical protein
VSNKYLEKVAELLYVWHQAHDDIGPDGMWTSKRPDGDSYTRYREYPHGVAGEDMPNASAADLMGKDRTYRNLYGKNTTSGFDLRNPKGNLYSTQLLFDRNSAFHKGARGRTVPIYMEFKGKSRFGTSSEELREHAAQTEKVLKEKFHPDMAIDKDHLERLVQHHEKWVRKQKNKYIAGAALGITGLAAAGTALARRGTNEEQDS